MEPILFAIFGAISVGGAIMVVTRRHPMTSALYLILTLFAVAALFALRQAHFLAVIQLLVYAGAIMVLFIFVIMLLNLQEQELAPRKRTFMHVISVALVLYALSQLIELLTRTPSRQLPEVGPAYGTTAEIGRLLFSDYLFAFEIVSVLILAAIVGAVVLAKRRLD